MSANNSTSEVSVPCHLYLPVVPAARVIGKGGASIRAIRESSGASVKVLQKELPREMQKREDRVVVIAGDRAAVQEALASVLERVFDRSGLPEADRGRRQLHTAEVIVPEKSGSHIIGQRGERIRALIEETECDINVAKESIDGLADQKRVRVMANSTEQAVTAVWKIQEVLLELAEGGVLKPEHFDLREAHPSGPAPYTARQEPAGREVPIRLLFGQEDAAWIVGKKGNKIMSLRDLAKVSMNEAESPPFEASDRVVEISAAALEQRVRVVHMIVDDLKSREQALPQLRVLVPTEKFGSVMGHKGETIRRIMSDTGAYLQQHKAEKLEDGSEYWLRLVEVRGGDFGEVVLQIHQAIEQRRSRDGGPDQNSVDLHSAGFGGSAAWERASSSNIFASKARPNGVAPPFSLPGLERMAEHDSGDVLTLELAMPSEEVARALARDASNIAMRAGVQLSVTRGPDDTPLLQVEGTAIGNSVACYLIQDRLFMMH